VRIIAGEFRGRRILSPQGDTTRPITDRAKQSLFDILQLHLPEAVVYDLFAGTGSMGLECLSRGAAHVTFFEQDQSALRSLRQNVAALNLQGRSRIIGGDLFAYFGRPSIAGPPPGICFLDPPYRMVRQNAAQLRALAEHLSGLVVFRHDEADSLELPPLKSFDQRRYGKMMIELLRK
jgi:16S rRNA (guanine966-N2)-methyltransferase